MAIKRKRIEHLEEQESLNYDIQVTSPKKHVKSSTPRAESSRKLAKVIDDAQIVEEITVPEQDLKTPKQKKARRRLLSNEAITTPNQQGVKVKERIESPVKEWTSQGGEHIKAMEASGVSYFISTLIKTLKG